MEDVNKVHTEEKLVGLAGFEPAASASRTQRSTKLSHSPLTENQGLTQDFRVRGKTLSTDFIHCSAGDVSKSQTSQEKWTKVGECLYRYKTSGGYYARIKIKGKEFRRSLRTTDLALAKRRLRELRNDFERIEPSSGKISLEELVKRFRATRGHLDASTQQRDDAIEKSMRRDWPSGYGQKVADVKPSDVEELARNPASTAFESLFERIRMVHSPTLRVRHCGSDFGHVTSRERETASKGYAVKGDAVVGAVQTNGQGYPGAETQCGC